MSAKRPAIQPRQFCAAVLCLLVVAALALSARSGLSPFELWQQRQLFLPPDFDSAAPDFARIGGQRHVLLFAKTNGYRRYESIALAQQMFEQMAADNSWFVYATQNAASFNEQTLAQFDSVVFNNVTGRVLTNAQQRALDRFVAAGGGFHAVGPQRYDLAFAKQLAGEIRSGSAVAPAVPPSARKPDAQRSRPPAPVSRSPAPQS